MVRGFVLKVLVVLFVAGLFLGGGVVSASGASGKTCEVGLLEVREFDFDSWDELVTWLKEEGTGTAKELGELLDQVREEDLALVAQPRGLPMGSSSSGLFPHKEGAGVGVTQAAFDPSSDEPSSDVWIQACLNPSATPSSITTPKPKTFKFFQIQFRVDIGDCGMILCSTLGFRGGWGVAPQGGALLFGPMPSRSGGQVCVGGFAMSNVYLILTKSVPSGSYRIDLTVAGFAGTATTSVPLVVQ